jgi:dihydroxy-acid dehydratase
VDESVERQPRSREVTRGYERAPARAMLRAVGMTDEDFVKPQIGVASSWNAVSRPSDAIPESSCSRG